MDEDMGGLFGFLIGLALVGLAIAAAVIAVISGVALTLAGYGTVLVTRDLVVSAWPRRWGSEAQQLALFAWLTLVPVSGATLTMIVATAFFHEHWLISLLCTVVFVGIYLGVYFNSTPKHHNWTRFAATTAELKFAGQIAVLHKQLELKLFRWKWAKRIRGVIQTILGRRGDDE